MLDKDGRPIRPPSRRAPAIRRRQGTTLYHWEIRVDRLGRDGQRLQLRRRVWRADAAAAELVEHALCGASCGTGSTWSGALALWTASHAERRAERHVGNVAADVRRLIDCLGDLPISDTSLPQYTRWLRTIRSASAAQHAYVHTMSVARWAAGEGEISMIPFAGAKRPDYRPPERHPATPQQFLAVASALPAWHRPLWLVLGYTGSRISAMTWLREEDVGDTHLEIRPKQAAAGGRTQQYLITSGVAIALEQARAWKREAGRTSEWVFLNQRGGRLTTDAHLSALEELWRRRPEVPRITPHQLRHMAGTFWGGQYTPTVVQAAMGHSDRRSSEPYTHRTQQMADEAARALATFLPQICTKSGNLAVSTDTPSTAQHTVGNCPVCGSIRGKKKALRPKRKAR